MPDHRIGISLDVRNNGTDKLQKDFEGVSTAADNLTKRFADIDKRTRDLTQGGWGSQQCTQELRNQLQMMQNMATLIERQAGRTGNTEAQKSMQGLGGQIGGAGRDIAAVRAASMPSSSDIARSIGIAAGEAVGAYLGGKATSLLYQGYNANMSMLPAFANMGQTMGNGKMKWAQSMLRAGQGYGYNNQQIMAGAQTIQGAAGNTPDFFNQIRGVAQFGRMNGFDYQQAANYFSGSYESGVTGGSGAQMSWQEYAILVANTVNAGNMTGKNAQVVESLQQLTSIAQQTAINAPNQQAVAGIYATATKGGNQALINQFPSLMSGLNSGVISPSSPYAQAWTLNAVAKGQSYYNAVYQQQQGIFGTDAKGRTNFQDIMTTAASKGSGGLGGVNKQSAVILGQMYGMTGPQMLPLMQQFIDKNGNFNSTAFNSADNGKLAQALATGDQTELDKYLQKITNPGQVAQSETSHTTGIGSSLSNLAFGNPLGQGLSIGTGVIASNAIAKRLGLGGLGKMLPNLGKVFRGSGGLGAEGLGAEGLGAEGLGVDAAVAGGADVAGAGLLATAGEVVAAPLAAGAASYWGTGKLKIGEKLSDWVFKRQHGGLTPDQYDASQYQRITGHAMGTASVLASTSQGTVRASGSQAVISDQFNASLEAQRTAAILMALRPWATEIEQWYGNSGSSGSGSGGSSSGMRNTNATFTPSSGAITGGDWLSNALGGASSPLGQWVAQQTGSPYTGVKTTSTLVAPASASAFVGNMKSYAQQTSKTTGLPVDFLLAQWGNESGWGKSDLATKNNNFAGIGGPGNWQSYSSPEAFAQADANFFTQNSRYSKLLADAKAGASDSVLAADLTASGYSANDPSYGSDITKNFLPVVDSALASQGGASGSAKVAVSAPKQVTVTIKDSSGKKVGSTMIPLTTQATMNGQSVSGSVGAQPTQYQFTGQIGH